MTMRNEIRKFQRETCALRDPSGVNNDGDISYAPARTVRCRVEQDVWTKESFEGLIRDRFTKVSVDEELSSDWEGLVYLRGIDTTDISKGSRPRVVRPVYDEEGRFAHTVLEL